LIFRRKLLSGSSIGFSWISEELIMQAWMNVFGLILGFVGLADFFVSKHNLERLSAAFKNRLESLERILLIKKGLKLFIQSDYAVVAPICIVIVVLSFFHNFNDDLHTTWEGMGNGFAGPVIYFFLPIFVGLPLSIIIIIVSLKGLLKYLIWCPKGVTSLLALPLACWLLYKQFLEVIQ
jgi:hypothetical protein